MKNPYANEMLAFYGLKKAQITLETLITIEQEFKGIEPYNTQRPWGQFRPQETTDKKAVNKKTRIIYCLSDFVRENR